MKCIFYSLVLIAFISCSEIESKMDNESCDLGIGDEGRSNIDTLTNEIGILRNNNDQYYIEVTRSDSEPYEVYISCMDKMVILPDIGDFIKFSGYVKDPCVEERSSLIDSLNLQEIEVIYPIETASCEQDILNEAFDIAKNDKNLTIQHLAIDGDCLQVLVSYTGSCNQTPELTLHNSGDILFGGVQIVVSLQGPIDDDCSQENHALLKYNLAPLWENLSTTSIDEVVLYFQSQGMLKIGYSKTE